MTNVTNIDPKEVIKFSQHANVWWDREGPFKTLHHLNPVRLKFITDTCSLKNKRVLDVGCGGGLLSEAMSQAGADVVGLDITEPLLDVAKSHALESNLTIDYVCCPIEEYEAEAFDRITCMEMLEHVPNPQQVIHHCARLLKPNGYLILSTINRTVKAFATTILAAEYVLELLPRQTHDFQKFIKPSELVSMGQDAGMAFLNMAGVSYNPWSHLAQLDESVKVNYLMAFVKRR